MSVTVKGIPVTHDGKRVRGLSGDIVGAYVDYIRDKVKEKDKRYTLSGIDGDYDVYRELFFKALDQVLSADRNLKCVFDESVVAECAAIIDKAIADSTECKAAKKYKDAVFEVCGVVFQMFENGLHTEFENVRGVKE